MTNEMESNGDKVSVALPKSVVERVRRRVQNSNEFKSVDEYIAYVMDQMLTELEGESEKTGDASPFSKKDQEDVEQRLRDLGYI